MKACLQPIAVAIIEELVTDWLSKVTVKDIENPRHSGEFQSMAILLEESPELEDELLFPLLLLGAGGALLVE